MAAVEAACHNCGEKEVVIGVGTMCSINEGGEVFNPDGLFAVDRVSSDFLRALYGGLHRGAGLIVVK